MKDGNWPLIMMLTGLLIGYHKQGRADMFGAKCAIETKATSFPGSSEVRFPNTFPDSIDLSKLPVSEKELPAFPAFGLPAGVVPLNKPVTRNFDRLFFPTHQGMIPLEGKVYKTFLTSETGKEWSLPYFEKTYKEWITAAGGVLLFQGKVGQTELDRIKDEATYFGEEGSIDYPNNLVRVYAIRRKDGDHFFIQLSGNSAGAAIQILQLPRGDNK